MTVLLACTLMFPCSQVSPRTRY